MNQKIGLLLYNKEEEIFLIDNWNLPIGNKESNDDLISALLIFKNITGIELDINNFNFINLGSHNNITIYATEYLDNIKTNIKYNWIDLDQIYKSITEENNTFEFIKRIEKYFLEDNEEEIDEPEESKSLNPEPIKFDDMTLQEKRIFYLKFLDLNEKINYNQIVLLLSKNIINNLKDFLETEDIITERTFYLKVYDDVKIHTKIIKKVTNTPFDIYAYTTFNPEESITYINANIYINMLAFPLAMNDFIGDIKDMLRHEIEHTTQEDNINKSMNTNDYHSPERGFFKEYILSNQEIPAFLHGFHAKAKHLKKSMNAVIEDFLLSRINWFDGDVSELEYIKQELIRKGKELLPDALWE